MVSGLAGRGRIAARALAATAGVYSCLYAAVGAAACLPWPAADAILYPALVAVPAHVALSIWAFAARSVSKVWLVLAASGLSSASLWAWAGQ
ncbi:MAG: iron transporter [Achromobacter pestifer]